MFRIFLPLYLILIFFIIIFGVTVSLLPGLFLTSTMSKFEDQLTRGTFHLIEQELQGLDEQQQHLAIEKLQTQFGYSLRLIKPGDPFINEENLEIVLTGSSIQVDADNADYNLKKLEHSDLVMAISFSESEAESSHKEAQGTFYLIKKRLLNQPQNKWPAIIHDLETYFGFPLMLINLDELAKDPGNHLTAQLENDPEMKLHFEKGKIIYFENDDDHQYYITKLEGSPYALQAGPIEPPFVALISFVSGILFLFIFGLATAIYLWVRPLWRSMNELSRTADDFGQGKLQARADIKPKAALGNLAIQFNAMAERIGRLIIGHRELTNAVSHELRTPIARMRFGLDMLQTANHTDQKSQQRYIEGLTTDVDDLEDLVNELLHYARFEQSDPLDDLQTVEIIPWLESIIENARGYAGDLKINCIKKNISDDQAARFSPRHMARVIHNLLRNASRYGKEKIKVSVAMNEEEIMIHVDDDGSGIPQEDRDRVFEAFSRLDESRDRQSGGHGLGLAIAKRIIEAHKGEISVGTSPAGGARFTIAWPEKISS